MSNIASTRSVSAFAPTNVGCWSDSDLIFATQRMTRGANNRLVWAGYDYVETSYFDMQ